MTASAEALLVAGVLAAHDRLEEALGNGTVVEACSDLIGPSTVWADLVLGSLRAAYDYQHAANERAATWTQPDGQVAETNSDELARGAAAITNLMKRPAYEPGSVIRLAVHSIPDAIAARRLGKVCGLDVTAHLSVPIGPWRWRWPLRVGVVDGPHAATLVDELHGKGWYQNQYEVRVVGAEEDVELDIVVADVSGAPFLGRAGAVFVIGDPIDPDDVDAVDERASWARQMNVGAIVALADRDLSWFEEAVRELSHDRPLDAAIGVTARRAFVVGDPDLFGVTALRNWMFSLANVLERRGGPAAFVAELRGVATEMPFDHEVNGGRETADRIRNSGIDHLEVLGDTARAAMPGEGAAPPPPEDRTGRRIHVKLVDPDGHERLDGFVKGTNTLTVAIVKKALGAVAADAAFESPTPGEEVQLEVLVHVGGSRAAPQRRTLTLPPSADSEWTEPIEIKVPARRRTLQVFVSVLWKGHAVQSAVLAGPVLAPAAPIGAPALTLTVDVSSAPSETAADATFVLVPAADGKPVVFDADRNVPIDGDTLKAANEAVRDVLIATLLRPPDDLRGAAKPLATLAVHGSLLRDALRRKEKTFYDDATWIHITSFAAGEVPFELIYTHPLPDPDQAKICAPALAGATGCAAACDDKDKADRVCPFAFWGTTKVIERRQHSEERAAASPSDQRTLTVRAGAVAAVTPLANFDDPTASKRIADALAAFAEQGTSTTADSWSTLEAAVQLPRSLVCLVTHTIPAKEAKDVLGTKLELGDEAKPLVTIDRRYVNPDQREPGPIVLALGCDTAVVHASYANFVARLHSQGAEIVVSAVAQIPGKEVADFVERFVRAFGTELARPGAKRFGTVMTAARRATLLEGDVLALALTASGDGDVQVG